MSNISGCYSSGLIIEHNSNSLRDIYLEAQIPRKTLLKRRKNEFKSGPFVDFYCQKLIDRSVK